LGVEFARTLSQKESKIFIYPAKNTQTWKNGAVSTVSASRKFWLSLVEFISSAGFFPVIYADHFAHDLSSDFTKDCLHMKGVEISKALSVMRSCGCVVDVFNGISRYALAARTPFVCLDERIKFNFLKDYEINDLCGRGVPREYIFGFGTLIQSGDESVWKSNIFDHLVVKLKKAYADMDRDSWPPTTESNEIVPYDSVRKKKNKRLGSRFIKIQRD
jgi:hypothetical protein